MLKRSGRRRILIIGPLPPPFDGTSVSFRLLCDELQSWPNVLARIVDSSPRKLKEEGSGFGLSDVAQATRVMLPFLRHVAFCERVVIFGSNGFLLRMAPVLVAASRLLRKPVTIRVFGGSLDRYYDGLSSFSQRVLLRTLRSAEAVSVQPRLLYERLSPLLGDRLHVAPGYRVLPTDLPPRSVHSDGDGRALRLVYVGHVREEKGVSVLLDALAELTPDERRLVSCDIYGPIYPSFAARFESKLESVENVSYAGVVSPDEVIRKLCEYNAFVFPSFYQGEGHPGALVEAILAGLPAIATAFRAIPELVEHGVNGLLVEPRDTRGLADAIRTLQRDPQILAEMAANTAARAAELDARRVIPVVLRQLGISAEPGADPSAIEGSVPGR